MYGQCQLKCHSTGATTRGSDARRARGPSSPRPFVKVSGHILGALKEEGGYRLGKYDAYPYDRVVGMGTGARSRVL